MRRLVDLLVLLGALALALGTALADEPRPTPAVAAPPADAGAADPVPSRAAPPAALPPGAPVPDVGPSTAIFPPQSIPLRFDHARHVGGEHLACATCHPGALTSHAAADRLLPRPVLCDGCHGVSHADLAAVQGQECGTCHLGWKPADGNRVARLVLPPPNLRFDHQKHAARNIGCGQCHGDIAKVGLATRDQLPRMKGCLACHQRPEAAARGDAKGACDTCHLPGGAGSGGTIRTEFPTGTLRPPRWMHEAQHDADFLRRHKYVAASDSAFCGNCHKEDECVACHDGRVRPRSIHPSDYLNLHATEARLATQKCQSCHREQSFCLTCHQRLGVSMSGPTAVREAGRFHPPKSEWSDAPRRPGHHAVEAMRNLNACVSCHIERDCVACHGGQGIGGGFNPHGGGFVGGCATQMRRNPRPCYVCHEPGAPVLARCQ